MFSVKRLALSVQRAFFNAQLTMCCVSASSEQYDMFSVNSAVCSVQFAWCSVQCVVCIVQSTVCIMYCVVYIV